MINSVQLASIQIFIVHLQKDHASLHLKAFHLLKLASLSIPGKVCKMKNTVLMTYYWGVFYREKPANSAGMVVAETDVCLPGYYKIF